MFGWGLDGIRPDSAAIPLERRDSFHRAESVKSQSRWRHCGCTLAALRELPASGFRFLPFEQLLDEFRSQPGLQSGIMLE